MSQSETFLSLHLKGGNDCNSGLPDLLVKGGAKIKKNVRIGGIMTADRLDIRSNGEIDGDLHVRGLITSDTARELVPNNAVENRRLAAYQTRVAAAFEQYQIEPITHTDNGDEDLYESRIGNFTKGMPHNSIGEVDPAAYNLFLTAIATGRPDDFDAIPKGGSNTRFTSPQAGLAFDLEGVDSHAVNIAPAPTLSSAWRAGEAVEDYWGALLRDVSFRDYPTDTDVAAACVELTNLTDFRGPTGGENEVTPGTIFRSSITGSIGGPFMSQFLYMDCPYGANSINQKIHTLLPGYDYGLTQAYWLNIQNGGVPAGTAQFDSTHRYIRNGRDLAQWLHVDVLYQAYFHAMLILLNTPVSCPLNVGNPYKTSLNQMGFATFGGPHIAALMPEVATRALKAVWSQKWNVHRTLRPEAYGGLVHIHKTGQATYPLHTDVLNSTAVANVFAEHGTYLLPLPFPEGSPFHPAYGSGHATVAGACVTILKAFFDGSHVLTTAPVHPATDGLTLEAFQVDPLPLTVEGELNKLAYNIASGRCFAASVHWRSDSDESLLLGEKVAIEILRDQKNTYNENFSGFTFNKFDGTSITI